MANSTHQVIVVPVSPLPHPDADTLSIVKVFDGFQCCIKTADWIGVEKAAYIQPDSLVDVRRPEFGFLAADANNEGFARVKARKLRGVLSFGLLAPVSDSCQIGDDVTEALGVKHYEPPTNGSVGGGGIGMAGEEAASPKLNAPVYDLESFRKFGKGAFEEGEPVLCSEKVHGCSSVYVYSNGEMHVRSRTVWKKEFPTYDHLTLESLTPKVGLERAQEIIEKAKSKKPTKNLWWVALDNTPNLRKFCEANPDVLVYGEVFGQVQDLRYGCGPGVVKFAAFDVRKDDKWLNAIEARKLLDQYGIPQVPLLNKVADGEIQPIPFNFDTIAEMAEGKSLVPGANHVREGVVVKPLVERCQHRLGRVCLKVVGAGYYARKETGHLVVCDA